MQITLKRLNGNALKIIACIFMTIDHIGYVLFPTITIFRILGRISFPIFCFLLAEGCKYTKNKFKHFALLFFLGILYTGIYYLFDKIIYANILLTFSFSTLIIYCLQYAKKFIFAKNKNWSDIFIACFLFFCSVLFAYFITNLVFFDYGFIGILLPVIISLFDFSSVDAPIFLKKLDCLFIKLLALLIGLLLLAFLGEVNTQIQIYGVLAILPLCLYNGERGKNLKYLFYIFYPLHLVIIEGIFLLTQHVI